MLIRSYSKRDEGELSVPGLVIIYLRLAKHCAHTVLKSPAVAAVHNPLIDDGKGKPMPIGCRAIACKRRHSSHCARLGKHIALGEGAAHSGAQCSVDTRLGQSRMKMQIDIVVAIGIAQEANLKFC